MVQLSPGPAEGFVSQNWVWSSSPPGYSVQHVLEGLVVVGHERGPPVEQPLEMAEMIGREAIVREVAVNMDFMKSMLFFAGGGEPDGGVKSGTREMRGVKRKRTRVDRTVYLYEKEGWNGKRNDNE